MKPIAALLLLLLGLALSAVLIDDRWMCGFIGNSLLILSNSFLKGPKDAETGLQPVRDTREKQVQLWKELILDYCKFQKVFLIGVEQDFPLFSNSPIDRTLSHEARETFLSAMVGEERAEWLDKGHRKCLVLWHRIQDWADIILLFVRENGLEDSVMTVEEIRSGTESLGTELEGIDRTILMRALKLLENKGKLVLFKGTSADDEGVKFSV